MILDSEKGKDLILWRNRGQKDRSKSLATRGGSKRKVEVNETNRADRKRKKSAGGQLRCAEFPGKERIPWAPQLQTRKKGQRSIEPRKGKGEKKGKNQIKGGKKKNSLVPELFFFQISPKKKKKQCDAKIGPARKKKSNRTHPVQ